MPLLLFVEFGVKPVRVVAVGPAVGPVAVSAFGNKVVGTQETGGPTLQPVRFKLSWLMFKRGLALLTLKPRPTSVARASGMLNEAFPASVASVGRGGGPQGARV